MPRKCCVPGCRSNFATPGVETAYVNCFHFPKQLDLRNKWLRSIPRRDWTPYENSVVCIKHFQPDCILLQNEYTDSKGQKQVFKYDHPKLVKGSCPSIFEGLPKYLTKVSGIKRKHPEERRRDIEVRNKHAEESAAAEAASCDMITSFESLCSSLEKRLVDNNTKVEGDSAINFNIVKEKVVIYCINFASMTFDFYIRVDNHLLVSVFYNNVQLSSTELSSVLGSETTLKSWRTLFSLLQFLTEKRFETTLENYAASILKLLACFKESFLASEEGISQQVNFLSEQFSLIFMNRKRYSPNMILSSYILYMQSGKCYETIRQNKFLALPHPKHLQRLTSSLNVSPGNSNENVHYLRKAAEKCDNKWVILQLDEIYVKEEISYRSGNLTGFAENREQLSEAKTVQVFMITGAFSSFEHVISLKPVKQLSGQELADMTKQSIVAIEECGFKVLCVISDNNRLNQNMFSILSQDSEDSSLLSLPEIDHPVYYMYDTVHLFKNIRNNWLNQKDSSNTFIIPQFDTQESNDKQESLLRAKFSDLRSVYREESSSILKQAFKLNYKTLYPTSLERQNVMLVINIFHESTRAALSAKGLNDTAAFITVIWKWWEIVNTKSKINGICRNNSMGMPFTSLDDERFAFLERFILWVNSWLHLGKQFHGGSLSSDTGKALIHSTKTLIALIRFALLHLSVDYVLPGKFQTDKLEKRFSMYRQMSGGNYSVSVREIMDSERKIRAKGVLGIRSARYGQIALNVDNLKICEEEIKSEDELNSILGDEILVSSILRDCMVNSDVDASALLFVCGYASFKTAAKTECKSCLDIIVGVNREDSYFEEINRGGLTVPSNTVMSIGKHAFRLMQVMVSSKYEAKFLKECKRHHSLLSSLIKLVVNEDAELRQILERSCACGAPIKKMTDRIICILCNIILSNYKKARCDKISSEKAPKRKRKLNTFK